MENCVAPGLDEFDVLLEVVLSLVRVLLGVITSLDEVRGCLFACSFSRYFRVSVSARCHHIPWRSERLSICLFNRALFPFVCFCSVSLHPLAKWEVVYLFVHSVVIPVCLFLLGVITSLDEVRGCLFACSFSRYSHVSVSARCHHIPWRSERLSICLFIQSLFPCVCFCSVSSHPLTKWEVVYLFVHSVVIPVCLFLLGVITSLDEVRGCLFVCSFSRYSRVSVSARCHHFPWRSERLSLCLFIQLLFPCVCFCSVSSHPLSKWEVVYLFVHSVVIPVCLFLLGVITSLDEVRGCLFACSFSRFSRVSVYARCHHIPWRSERLSICLFIQSLFPCVCFCSVSSHPLTKWEVVYLLVHSVVIPVCLFLLGVITSLDEVRGCLFACSFSRYSRVSVSARCHHIPWRSERLSICLFIQSSFPCVCFCSVSSHPLTKWEVVYLFVHSVVIPVCLFLLGVITSLGEVRGCLFVCSVSRYSRVSVSARCHHIPCRSKRLSICLFIQSFFPCVCFCSVSSHPLTKWEVVYLLVHSVVIPVCLFLLGVITSLDEVRGCLFACSFSRYSRVSVSACHHICLFIQSLFPCVPHHIPWRSERLSICLFIQSLFPCVCFCSTKCSFSHCFCFCSVSSLARSVITSLGSERLSICLFIQSLFPCVCFCSVSVSYGVITSLGEVRGCLFALFIQSLFPCVCFCSVSSHPSRCHHIPWLFVCSFSRYSHVKWEVVYLFVHSVVIPVCLFLLGVITSLDEVRGCLFVCSFSRYSRVSVSARCHHIPWRSERLSICVSVSARCHHIPCRSERLSICLFIQSLFPCVCFCSVSSHPLTKWEVVEVRGCLFVCSFSRYSRVSVSARCHHIPWRSERLSIWFSVIPDHIPWRSERLSICLFIQSLFPCVCFCLFTSFSRYSRVSVSARCHHIPWRSERLSICLFIQSLFPCVCFCSVSSHPLAKWEVVYLFVHSVIIPVCLFPLGVITSLDEVRGCLFACSFSRYSRVSVSARCHHIPWRSESCLFVCSFSRYSHVSVSARCHHIPWRSERLSICLFIQSLFPCVCFCSVSSHPLAKWEVVYLFVHSVVIPVCLFLLGVITSLGEVRGCLFVFFIQSLFPCVCFCWVSSHPLAKWEVVYLFVHSVVIPVCLFLLGVITSLVEVRGCLFACSIVRYSRVSVSAGVITSLDEVRGCLFACSFSCYTRVSVSARCHHIPWRSERLSICLFIQSLFPYVCFCSVSSHPLTKWEVVYLFVHSVVIPVYLFLLGVITSLDEVRGCLFVCSFSRYSRVSVSARCHHIPWRSERLSICLFIQSLFPCVCFCSVSSHPLTKWEVVYLLVHSVVIPVCLFLLVVITSLDEVRGCLFACSFSRYSHVSVFARCHHIPCRSERLSICLFIQSLFPCVCFCSVSSHPLAKWEVVYLLVHSVVIPVCLFLLGVIISLDEVRGCLFVCSFSRYSRVSVSARLPSHVRG